MATFIAVYCQLQKLLKLSYQPHYNKNYPFLHLGDISFSHYYCSFIFQTKPEIPKNFLGEIEFSENWNNTIISFLLWRSVQMQREGKRERRS